MPKFSVGADTPRKRCSMSTCSLACYSDIAASPVIVHHRDERDERQMDQRQTGKQVNAGIGSSLEQARARRRVIRNRCSGGHPASELDRQSVWRVREWLTKETQWHGRLWERPPAVLFETDDLEGQLIPPATVTVWDSTAALGRFGRNFLEVTCGVVESTGILKHYIPFQLPVKCCAEADDC